MTTLRIEKVEANCARLGAFGANAVAYRFFSIFGHQRLQLSL